MAEVIGRIPPEVLRIRKMAHEWNEKQRRHYLAKKRREEEEERRVESGKFNRPHFKTQQ